MGRRRAAQLSVLNDLSLREYAALMITEPNIMEIEGAAVVHQHQQWTVVKPTLVRQDSVIHSFRSLLYVNKKTRFQQVHIPSSDIVAGLVITDNQQLLVTSVYVPRDPSASKQHNASELAIRLDLIEVAWQESKMKWGANLQLFVAGDFNRHDQLWGGDEVISSQYHGEGTPLLEWMGSLGMQSMLPRGTKTFQVGQYETTIDLVLASSLLASRVLKCQLHDAEHGSDHRAISSTFSDGWIDDIESPKYNYRKTNWEAINAELRRLTSSDRIDNVRELEIQSKAILTVVEETLARHTPKKRPSPYMKAWWDEELSILRREYTILRNKTINIMRNGSFQPDLEAQVTVARRRFHKAIRDKKKRHWHDFLDEPSNMWKAARYLRAGHSGFGSIPVLVESGREIEQDQEKAQTLLRTFFPSTPDGWSTTTEDEHTPVIQDNPDLTTGEIEEAIRQVKPWKAPGVDGLPSVVWKATWPVLKEWIHAIFQASIKLGVVPAAWKIARILPLRKPNKADYTVPKAYRPISLLPTLGKVLELVVARRLSFWAETYSLLPEGQFGARPRRSCDQALVLLMEKIKEAWRRGKILSLISFDVKGAYNGVPRQVMASKLASKGIPLNVVQWVESFCSDRRATVVVNGMETEAMDIPFPGLPQGSPLSPILYIFFNADLVQQASDRDKGSMGFVDDYSSWVTGESVEENMSTLQNVVVPRAIQWATRNGAKFEGEKTTLIHFTHFRKTKKIARPLQALRIEEAVVAPSQSAKILGVIFDRELMFKDHVARAAKRGWQGIQALTRLKGVRPATARQLYSAVVTSRIDYGAAVWCSPYVGKGISIWMKRLLAPIQRMAAKSITNCFRTVAEEPACAEAGILSTQDRLVRKITKFWVDSQTLPRGNPLWNCMRTAVTARPDCQHQSPCMFMRTHILSLDDTMERVVPFAVTPWQQSVRTMVSISSDRDEAIESCQGAKGLEFQVSTDASMKNGRVGCAIVAGLDDSTESTLTRTIGTSDAINVYVAELSAIMEAVEWIQRICWTLAESAKVTIYSDNMSVLLAISNPRHQSGQFIIQRIIQGLWSIQRRGRKIRLAWVPAHAGLPGNEAADRLAATTTTRQSVISTPSWLKVKLRSVVLGMLERRLPLGKPSSDWVAGRRLKEVDSALPGKHVRLLYDTLTRREAQALAQLRTGHSKLRGFLSRIGLEKTDQCECGQGREDTRHFLFHCPHYQQYRDDLVKEAGNRYGDLSFMLRGRSSYQRPDGSSPDGPQDKWKPNLPVVRAVIRYTLLTGRL